MSQPKAVALTEIKGKVARFYRDHHGTIKTVAGATACVAIGVIGTLAASRSRNPVAVAQPEGIDWMSVLATVAGKAVGEILRPLPGGDSDWGSDWGGSDTGYDGGDCA